MAEAFRQKVLKALGRRHGPDARSEVLSGKGADGRPLRSHRHAHYLPTAEGGDGRRVTHLTVYAEGGFGPDEVVALTSVRDLNLAAGGDRELSVRVQLIGLGSRGQFRGAVPLFGRAAAWASATPFVAHRHLKRRGAKRDTSHLTGPDPRAGFAELALRELVARRGLGAVTVVKRPESAGEGGPRPAEFGRGRSRAWDDGDRRPFGSFRLVFACPIDGPVCLGYACHYGLGLFLPDDRPERSGAER